MASHSLNCATDWQHNGGYKPSIASGHFTSRIAGLKYSSISFGLLLFLLISGQGWAQTETVLYSFSGTPDGRYPLDTLTLDTNGNLYGTTFFGGASDLGSIFRLDTDGNETILHSFNGGDGGYPVGGLLLDTKENLYGTTQSTGRDLGGTVFRLDSSGKETAFSFNNADGLNPEATLVRDAHGHLYGTTSAGGTYGYGTVFVIGIGGEESVLYSFGPPPDGSQPRAGVVRDIDGNLYGTTYLGGQYGYGTVFKVDSLGNETVLHSFSSIPDGAYPADGLIRDSQGNLYGTALAGANNDGCVFKIDSIGNETLIYSFQGGSDGGGPNGSLLRDATGNLYGTTYSGGSHLWGTLFKIDPNGSETVLYTFSGQPDGAEPFGGLVLDTKGNLYGTTGRGGTYGLGTVFKLSAR